MNPGLAKNLIKEGYDKQTVISNSGVTVAVYFQLKREIKSKNRSFGCVVCGGKKHGKIFCEKHYHRYLI